MIVLSRIMNIVTVVGFFLFIGIIADAHSQEERLLHDLRPHCEVNPKATSFQEMSRRTEMQGVEYTVLDMKKNETVKAVRNVWEKSGVSVPNEYNLYAVVVTNQGAVSVRMKKIGEYRSVCFVLQLTPEELQLIVSA